jgi:hypothetical protein
MKKVKEGGITPKATTNVAKKDNECTKAKGRAKAIKVDRKAKARPISLPWVIAPLIPAAIATNLDTKTVNVANVNTTKNKRFKPTMVNT